MPPALDFPVFDDSVCPVLLYAYREPMVFVLLTPVRPALVTNARDLCGLLVLLVSGVEAFVVFGEDLTTWLRNLPKGFPLDA